VRALEHIVAWNQRVTAGETPSSWPADDCAASLPLVALTCIDPRLNTHFPNVLGLREEQFIWLRNAGNVVSSSTTHFLRSLALACALKGGREIAIIGHTDCAVRKATMNELIDGFRALGIAREQLPEDLRGYFGLFASERDNVIRGVDFVRRSPIIGPATPVHGLLIDVASGRLEWVVNGYEAWSGVAVPQPPPEPPALPALPPSPEPLRWPPDGKVPILTRPARR
jgi:carbonic anhydrase